MEAAGTIPGYAYGSDELDRSPVSDDELALLKQAVLDVWYGFVASHPHLVRYFAGPDGAPIDDYLSRVRVRFGQWIHDLCERPWDRAWLDYQEEIALRHTRAKKNQTDAVEAPEQIPLRYMVAFVYPITATVREFLAQKGHSEEEVEAMHQAWFKAVTLSVVLWSRPYAGDGW